MYSIQINSREILWHRQTISYYDIVARVKNPAIGALYSVTYSKGLVTDREGILLPGSEVHVKDGMIFNAYITDNA